MTGSILVWFFGSCLCRESSSHDFKEKLGNSVDFFSYFLRSTGIRVSFVNTADEFKVSLIRFESWERIEGIN